MEDSFQSTKLSSTQANKNYCGMHALHNFIRENHLADKEFDRCDNDESYQPLLEETRRRRRRNTRGEEMELDSVDMNRVRDTIADGLFNRR